MTNYIIIGGKEHPYHSFEELVQFLLGPDYYQLSVEERLIRRIQRARIDGLPKHLNVTNMNEPFELEKSILIDSEHSYIYSLLFHDIIIILEQKESKILGEFLNREELSENYIVMNAFARKALQLQLLRREIGL